MGKKQRSKRTRVILSDPKYKETSADKARRKKNVKDMQDRADREIANRTMKDKRKRDKK